MKLFDVIEALVEERGLEKDVLTSIVCEGMLAAYQKRYPLVNVRVHVDKKSGELLVEAEKPLQLIPEAFKQYELVTKRLEPLKSVGVEGLNGQNNKKSSLLWR